MVGSKQVTSGAYGQQRTRRVVGRMVAFKLKMQKSNWMVWGSGIGDVDGVLVDAVLAACLE